MSTCPTVRIKSDAKGHEAGVVINKADFDPKKHEIFGAEKPVLKLKFGKPAGRPRK